MVSLHLSLRAELQMYADDNIIIKLVASAADIPSVQWQPHHKQGDSFEALSNADWAITMHHSNIVHQVHSTAYS